MDTLHNEGRKSNKNIEKLEKMEKLKNLDFNPILKQLLINYVLRMYEDQAITDDWHLYEEYLMLVRENRLHEIFENECLTNKLNDENYNCGDDRG